MADDPSPRSAQVRHILTMVRWLLILAFIVLGYLVLARLAPIFTPLVVAAGVAYLLDGAVDALTARGVSRTVAVALLLAAFLGLVVLVLTFAIPLITEELIAFVQALPGHIQTVSAWAEESFGVELPSSWREYAASPQLEAWLSDYGGPAATIAAAAVGGLFSVIGVLAELLIIPVFAFYFLVDWDHMVARARDFVPPRHREAVTSVVVEIDGAVSTWIRGQLIVIATLAVLYATAFRILDVPMGITVGALVGLLTIIPFLGTIVGAVVTGLLLVLEWQGSTQLLSVAGVFVVLHVVEGAVLTPKLVGKKVGLGEVGALFAVIAGGELLGFVGVLLAVPLAASVAVLVRRALRYYEQSDFYARPAAAAAAAPPPEPAADEEP